MQNHVLVSSRKWAGMMGLLALLFMIQGCGPSQQEQEEPPMETLPMNQISLDDLEDFQQVTGNWSIAGGVESDRQTEHDLDPQDGTGILVNLPTEENQEHIFTQWEHGDIELELDFLMPRGSNSGIYLMGRYEVQLLDSWGVEEPQFSDVGGIYERWDDSQPEGQKGFEGSAPLLNAARAPGLWQHYKILFQSPEFDDNGNKVSNAKFKEVWLNGTLVQENVEVTGPTRAAPFEDEAAQGPLMIQGDHGPVAIRNVEYKRYDKKQISLSDLTYEYYPGEYDQIPDFSSLKAGETSSTDSLAGNVVERDDRYALRYTGTLEVPNSGTYLFKLRNAGMVRMLIDGQLVFEQTKIHRMHQLSSETIELESGEHELTLEYLNHPNDWYWGLSLLAEGPQLRLQRLHKRASAVEVDEIEELSDLIINPPDDRVKTLRSFAMHNGSKRTHVVSVGAPNGINYSYDLGQSALLHVWEGPFVNANEMWIDRGEPQIAKPAGPPVTFKGYPAIATLNSSTAAWPDSLSWDQLEVEGYSIADEGWPIFKYSLGDVQVRDHFTGTDDNRRVVRTVEFKAPQPQQNVWFQLASGSAILQNSDGEYVVDDRAYYLDVVDTGSQSPQVVQNGEGYDLRIPVLTDGAEATIEYEIIW